MTGPAQLEVLLHVPEPIRAGLASGFLTPWGGTIRDPQGRIRALLTEGRALLQGDVPFDPKRLAEAIGHAETAAHIASGIGLLNLGVSVAGFVMVRERLDAIAGRLGQAMIALGAVKEEVIWIGGVQMAQLRGGMLTALDMAARAYRQQDRQLFNDAKTEAFRVRHTLHHVMALTLEGRRALRRQQVFLEFAQASAMLAVAEARCDEAVEGVIQAGHALRLALGDLRQLVDAFDQQRRDFLRDPGTMIELGSDGRARTAAVAAGLASAVRQLEGTAGQLALREALGLAPERWQMWTAPEQSGLLTCISTSPGTQTDLLEWALGKLRADQKAES